MEELVKTKKGHPALWENGGGMTNTGHARIICDSEGNRKRPVFVKTGGHLALNDHALFVVQEGDVVIDIQRHHDDYDISVKQIKRINQDAEGHLVAEMEVLAHFSEGEWDHADIAEKFSDAINAGKDKSRCYHCRSPHYATDHPEFQRKVTIYFNDKILTAMTELCQQLGFGINFEQIPDRPDELVIPHVPVIDKNKKKIHCEYKTYNDLTYQIINILRDLERADALEIEHLHDESYYDEHDKLTKRRYTHATVRIP
jgi:formyltetrahydrofolate synthetase